ncbi:MAG: NAD-dependent epimerase/dehydratase family protein [Proteobacteria bacterium]|nr:NAD-dependent epimerase/dehydratase family protein [Pseudomonadota bacterium]
MIKDKRILITGGRGFIGSALAKRLAPNNDVVCFDISTGNDILDKRRVASAVIGSQIVIHTAARVGVGEVLADTIATLQVNYTGTANVLQSALDNTTQLKRVLCFSTSEIFGVGADKVAEHGTPIFPDATDPRWCYALSKLAAEHLALGYYKQYGLPITIVRPFNVFGEGRTGNHALLHFIKNALNGEDLVVYGDGSQVRAWCHIDDFCDAIIGMLDTDKAIGKAFNIGNPVNVITVKDLAEGVIQLCQSSSKVVFKPLPFTDIDIRIPDITLARSVLAFSPKVGLEEGLRRTIEWVKNNV